MLTTSNLSRISRCRFVTVFIWVWIYCSGVVAHPITDVSNPIRVVPVTRLYIDFEGRGIDNVGPAISNATQSAIEHGEEILANYSSVLHGLAIPTGLAVTFFGYFLLAPVLFLAAFVTGGGACFIAVNAILEETTPTEAWIAIGAMLLGGALFGFIAMRALPVGMFSVGAALGVIFASSVRTSLIANLFPKEPRAAFVAIAVSLGLLLGLLAVFFQKQMLIFSTSYAGACACSFGVGHLVGHFPTKADLSDVESGHFNPWVILYLAVAAVLGTAGMLFQFWLTKDRSMHEYAPYDRRRRHARRRHRYERTPWGDDDDDWEDEIYAERAPPRRRPDPPARTHADEYSDRRLVEPVYVVPAKGIQRPTTTTIASGPSWNSVQQAPSVFEASPETATSSTNGESQNDKPVSFKNPPLANRESEVVLEERNIEDELTLHEGRSRKDSLNRTSTNHSPFGFIDSEDNSTDAINFAVHASSDSLVDVPLENDTDLREIKV